MENVIKKANKKYLKHLIRKNNKLYCGVES